MPGLKLAIAVLVLLAGVGGAGLLWARADMRPAQLSAVGRQVATAGAQAGTFVIETLRSGQTQAPAMMAGLGALVVVPLVAVAMLFARRVGNVWAATDARESRTRRADSTAVLPRLAKVWIDVDGPRRRRMHVGGELVRIGRDEENDLQLEDPNVHRHHAIIQRTSDAEFVVIDVSGVRGNGVAVNGQRLARARLRDGDLIEIGTSRVRFRCEPISHALPA